MALAARDAYGPADTVFTRTPHYFTNQANESNRDVMEFLLWKRKADQLGIRLKPEILPLSNIPGYLPPFFLSPGRVFVRS